MFASKPKTVHVDFLSQMHPSVMNILSQRHPLGYNILSYRHSLGYFSMAATFDICSSVCSMLFTVPSRSSAFRGRSVCYVHAPARTWHEAASVVAPKGAEGTNAHIKNKHKRKKQHPPQHTMEHAVKRLQTTTNITICKHITPPPPCLPLPLLYPSPHLPMIILDTSTACSERRSSVRAASASFGFVGNARQRLSIHPTASSGLRKQITRAITVDSHTPTAPTKIKQRTFFGC